MDDFKTFVAQRFIDQDRRNDDNRAADNRLLDERFKTQTENISKALDASQIVSARQDDRIKELEDKVGAGNAEQGGKRLLKSDIQGYVMMLVVLGGLLANILIAVYAH